MTAIIASRRHVLAGTGALIVSFSSATKLLGEAARQGGPEQTEKPPLPGSLKANPRLDSWVRIEADGSITIFTGKAELGQGIKTALLQVAAEQLDVPLASLKLITADTSITPNEGFTAGSRSMQDSGSAILHAAAQARAILLATAGERLGVAPSELKTQNGTVIAPSGSNIRYRELVSDELLEVEAQPQSHLKEPGTFRIIGNSAQRVDIPAKVTGGEAYVHDLRLPGMVHARVVRPPSYGARLVSVSTDSVKGMAGVLKVVRDGDFLAVIAEREFQAIMAMRKLAANARWDEKATLPRASELPSFITSLEAEDTVILDRGQPQSADGKRFEATFTRPYQVHGSIGPSCAVARSGP